VIASNIFINGIDIRLPFLNNKPLPNEMTIKIDRLGRLPQAGIPPLTGVLDHVPRSAGNRK